MNPIITGIVEKGKQLGRKLGFPTANIPVDGSLPFGVYIVRVNYGDQSYDGIANIGIRPTVERDSRPMMEVHLFDFSGDLYGQQIEVKLLRFLRGEAKFDSTEALREQIGRDIAQAKQFFQSEKER